MCGKTLIFLQIICGFSFGLEPRIVYEHTHHIQGGKYQYFNLKINYPNFKVKFLL